MRQTRLGRGVIAVQRALLFARSRIVERHLSERFIDRQSPKSIMFFIVDRCKVDFALFGVKVDVRRESTLAISQLRRYIELI